MKGMYMRAYIPVCMMWVHVRVHTWHRCARQAAQWCPAWSPCSLPGGLCTSQDPILRLQEGQGGSDLRPKLGTWPWTVGSLTPNCGGPQGCTGQGTEEEEVPDAVQAPPGKAGPGAPLPPARPAAPRRPAQGRCLPDLKASGRSGATGSQALMGPMAEASWY